MMTIYCFNYYYIHAMQLCIHAVRHACKISLKQGSYMLLLYSLTSTEKGCFSRVDSLFMRARLGKREDYQPSDRNQGNHNGILRI